MIVDDEPMAREIIVSYLGDFDEIGSVIEAVNGVDAIEKINNENPDLLFLDIQMPRKDGIAVLDDGQLKNQPITVFTTAYDQYALKAFELNAIDYLLKPFDRERFHQTMTKALEKFRLSTLRDFKMEWAKIRLDYENSKLEKPEHRYPPKLVVRDSKKIRHIDVQNIITICAAGDYVEINEPSGKFLLYKTIAEIEARLNPENFRRIHKSAIINLNRIMEIRPHTNGEYYFHLADGHVVKSGRTYKESISDLVKGNI